MVRMAETSELLLCFVTRLEKQSGYYIESIHLDNGTEFHRAFDEMDRKRVDVSNTTEYTSESNGLAERTHRVIMSLACTCLQEPGIPASYWNYSVRHVSDFRKFFLTQPQ